MKDLIPLAALILGCILGYLAHGPTTLQLAPPAVREVTLPSNWDPSAPLVSEALKDERAATARCYKDLVAVMTERADKAKKTDKAITH